MEQKTNLPFKVGDLAEASTFEEGYRGAWFRCKILEISTREGNLGHVSEYYDFPDEKLEWTELYQMTPYHENKIQLMLRPHYPPIYRESQMPLVSEISEATVIVDDAWKVGDFVDWWTTDCYWSGRIMRLLGNYKAMVKLEEPPVGEGDTYKVLFKDLRPSLDWSAECGWTVPPLGGENGRVCARIIEPLNQGRACARIIEPLNQAHEAGQETMSGHKKDELEDRRISGIQTQGSEDRRTLEQSQAVPRKSYGSGGMVAPKSMETDTLEAAIMDLEELLCKVKWFKNILENGVSFSDGARPEWEFVDQSISSSPPK